MPRSRTSVSFTLIENSKKKKPLEMMMLSRGLITYKNPPIDGKKHDFYPKMVL